MVIPQGIEIPWTLAVLTLMASLGCCFQVSDAFGHVGPTLFNPQDDSLHAQGSEPLQFFSHSDQPAQNRPSVPRLLELKTQLAYGPKGPPPSYQSSQSAHNPQANPNQMKKSPKQSNGNPNQNPKGKKFPPKGFKLPLPDYEILHSKNKFTNIIPAVEAKQEAKSGNRHWSWFRCFEAASKWWVWVRQVGVLAGRYALQMQTMLGPSDLENLLKKVWFNEKAVCKMCERSMASEPQKMLFRRLKTTIFRFVKCIEHLLGRLALKEKPLSLDGYLKLMVSLADQTQLEREMVLMEKQDLKEHPSEFKSIFLILFEGLFCIQTIAMKLLFTLVLVAAKIIPAEQMSLISKELAIWKGEYSEVLGNTQYSWMNETQVRVISGLKKSMLTNLQAAVLCLDKAKLDSSQYKAWLGGSGNRQDMETLVRNMGKVIKEMTGQGDGSQSEEQVEPATTVSTKDKMEKLRKIIFKRGNRGDKYRNRGKRGKENAKSASAATVESRSANEEMII